MMAVSNTYEASNRTLLYYPTIDIPSSRWLRQAVMYWDQVASVVPLQFDEPRPRYARYSKHIQPLYDARIFRPVDPASLSNHPDEFELFATELFKILTSREFEQLLAPLHEREFSSTIYRDKVTDRVFRHLKKLNLAAKINETPAFYYFEPQAALVYMAVLAKYLANTDHQYTIPGTDDEKYEQLCFQAAPEEKTIPCLRIEFRDLLRVPREDVPLERVIEFRLKRNNELITFRREVLDKFQDDLRECKTRRDVQLKTSDFRQQTTNGLKELDKVLKAEKLPIVTGTLKAICKPEILVATATSAGIAAAASGPAAAAIAPIAAVSGFVGAAVIEVFDFFATQRNKKLEKLSQSAYSYLYHAERELKV